MDRHVEIRLCRLQLITVVKGKTKSPQRPRYSVSVHHIGSGLAGAFLRVRWRLFKDN